MPLLDINEDERIVLDVALMEHRRNLMKEWEKIRGKGRWNPVSRNQECDWLDDKIVLAGLLRDRLAKLTAGGDETQITEAEAKRRTAVANMIIAEIDAAEHATSGHASTENTPAPRAGSGWHYEHGWLPSVLNKLEELKAFDDARNEATAARRRISEQLAAFHDTATLETSTWTTLPDEFDLDGWPFDVTDPEPTTAGTDVQTKNGKIRIDLVVGGKTVTVEGDPEAAARLLRDLDLAQRGF
jgi:hypothetical protein